MYWRLLQLHRLRGTYVIILVHGCSTLGPSECWQLDQCMGPTQLEEGTFCVTSTGARLLIRDGDRGGRGRKSEGSTSDTARKRPERPWTAARTMEVLRRCPLAIAQRLVQLRNCCFNRPAHDLFWANLRSSSTSLLLISPECWQLYQLHIYIYILGPRV